MTTAILLGIGTGLGLWLVLTWAIPPQATLRSRLTESNDVVPISSGTDVPWAVALARPVIPGLRALGLPGGRMARDLQVVGRGADTQHDALRTAARWAREQLAAGAPPCRGLSSDELAALADRCRLSIAHLTILLSAEAPIHP